MTRAFDRRSFLRGALGLSAATLLDPERVLADPYAPWQRWRPRGPAVRVRGRVTSNGFGIGGVRISDGLEVVRTDADGRYELITDGNRDFVSMSTPAGYRIDQNPTGTARFYRAIPSAGGEIDAPFELTRLAGSDEQHTMLWLPDVQTQDAWEMERFHDESVPDVIETVRALGGRHTFGIAGGDIMFDDLSLYPEYERAVQRMGIPFFQVVGNHDLDFDGAYDEATTETFSRHFGPRYYSFDRGAVHYVVMDDVFWHGTGYIGYLQQDQLLWLANDLADVEPGAPVVVCLHIPLLGTRHTREGQERPGTGGSINNREALYRLLEPYRAHVLSGHTHENDHNRQGGVHEHVSGTVCGAWWSGHICADGTPNGYSVYEVSGEDIRWRYKGTGLAAHDQLRAYEPGADPRRPGEVVANVWDASDDWDVVWYEDGERRGRMQRVIGHDPLSVREHAGESLPTHRPWVDPYPRYLYTAPVSEGAGEIRVTAEDPFGRRYVAVAGPLPRIAAPLESGRAR